MDWTAFTLLWIIVFYKVIRPALGLTVEASHPLFVITWLGGLTLWMFVPVWFRKAKGKRPQVRDSDWRG